MKIRILRSKYTFADRIVGLVVDVSYETDGIAVVNPSALINAVKARDDLDDDLRSKLNQSKWSFTPDDYEVVEDED